MARVNGNESKKGIRFERRQQAVKLERLFDKECEELSIDSKGIVVSYLGDTGMERV